MSKSVIIGQCFSGIVLLAIAAGVGAGVGVAITVMTLGILGAIGEAISIGVPIVCAILLFVRGRRPERRGYALAPFAGFGLWLTASIAMRAYISFTSAEFDPPTQIDPELAKIRTLVVDYSGDPSPFISFVSEGIIDRLVTIAHKSNDLEQPIESIKQTSLARGDACTVEDNQASGTLHAAGRTDECFETVALTEVPDGLHILRPVRPRRGASLF